MADFFQTLNYSSCNEDWRTERQALRIGPRDTVLCVTGGGDRPLHLLLDDPVNVAAIDANPWQNALLQLKVAALKTLPYADYIAFLGLVPSRDRRALFARVAKSLPEEATRFWDANFALIEDGVLYQGRWERYYRGIARLARTLRGNDLDRLFALEDLDQQRAFVRQVWDRKYWRLTYDVLCSRLFSRLFLGDPAFFRGADPAMRIGSYIYDRMLTSLETYRVSENFMISLLFRGELPAGDLPPYLAEASFATLRARADRLMPVTANLVEYLEQGPSGRYSRFSLSDVPSYLDTAGFERLLEGMIHAAEPGAIFCIRQFLSGHAVPKRLERVLERDPALEKKLEREDRAFAYRFIVGRISKTMGV